MLSFRNTSFEDDSENGHHLQNGTIHTGTTINNNSAYKRDHASVANGTTSAEHRARDQTYLSRDYPHVQEPSSARSKKCRWRCKITANAIDAWSRVLFPLAYGLFIVAYWILYSSNANTDKI